MKWLPRRRKNWVLRSECRCPLDCHPLNLFRWDRTNFSLINEWCVALDYSSTKGVPPFGSPLLKRYLWRTHVSLYQASDQQTNTCSKEKSCLSKSVTEIQCVALDCDSRWDLVGSTCLDCTEQAVSANHHHNGAVFEPPVRKWQYECWFHTLRVSVVVPD